MKIKLFCGPQLNYLEKEVNKYLENIDDDQIVTIQMTESGQDNSIMVVTKA